MDAQIKADPFHGDFWANDRQPLRNRARHVKIIEANADAIAGKRILDLASNNGRWTYAALKAGAAHVVGVEGRKEAIERGCLIFEREGITGYEFICGDVFDYLSEIPRRPVDTILCLGIYYHILDHYRLLVLMARHQPQTIIIDSGFVRSFRNLAWVKSEETDLGKNALPRFAGQKNELVGQVSLGMMIQMAWNVGYNCRPVPWRRSDFVMQTQESNAVKDYLGAKRFTVRLERTGEHSDPDWQEHWREAMQAIHPKFLALFDRQTHDSVAEQRDDAFSLI